MMFHDVVTSCCATEYAVACSEVATPFSEATLNAWFTPAPPGVAEVTLAIELPPAIRIRVWKLTGMS